MLELSAPWFMHMDARKLLAWLYFPIKQKVKLFKNVLSLKIGADKKKKKTILLVNHIYGQEYLIVCEICAYLSLFKSKGRATVFFHCHFIISWPSVGDFCNPKAWMLDRSH